MTNTYSGYCRGCKRRVLAGTGELERIGRKWVVWCMPCFDESDNSGPDDRMCGNRAYEDQCARAVGGDGAGGWNGGAW